MSSTKHLHLMLTAQSKADEVIQKTGRSLNDLKAKGDALAKGGGIMGALGAAAGGISAGVVVNSLVDTAQRMLAQADAAQRAGASIEGYTGLMYAAGRHADALSPIIDKLSVSIGQATTGSTDMAQGFRNLGLEVDTLARMPTDQAFLKVAGALTKQEDAYKRNAMAAKVMGEEVKKLMPFILKGEEGIRQQLATGRGVVSEQEIAEIKKADEVFRGMAERWEKFKRAEAIGWAHILNDLSGKTDMNAMLENARKAKLTPLQLALEQGKAREPVTPKDPFREFAKSEPTYGPSKPGWWQDINRHMAEQNRIRAEAAAITEANLSPLERLRTEYENLTRVWNQGGLAADVYERAIAKLVGEFDNLQSAANVTLPSLREKGSSEAVSAINRFRAETVKGESTQERIARILEQMKADNAKSSREATKIREAFDRMVKKLGVM